MITLLTRKGTARIKLSLLAAQQSLVKVSLPFFFEVFACSGMLNTFTHGPDALTLHERLSRWVGYGKEHPVTESQNASSKPFAERRPLTTSTRTKRDDGEGGVLV